MQWFRGQIAAIKRPFFGVLLAYALALGFVAAPLSHAFARDASALCSTNAGGTADQHGHHDCCLTGCSGGASLAATSFDQPQARDFVVGAQSRPDENASSPFPSAAPGHARAPPFAA